MDHVGPPKANPATSATPTPALYDHAPIFLAITAYIIPVPKNRTYTNTKPRASQFHPSTTCDATSGAIKTPAPPAPHAASSFPGATYEFPTILQLKTIPGPQVVKSSAPSPRRNAHGKASDTAAAASHTTPGSAGPRRQWPAEPRAVLSTITQAKHHFPLAGLI